jgi:hypothetical protein
MALFSRNDWIINSSFHPLSTREVLEKVEASVEIHLQGPDRETKPIILFDLDSTLYEVGHRTLAIIQDWNKSPKAPVSIQEELNQLKLEHIGYSLSDLARNLGLEPTHPEIQKDLNEIKPFWWDRFFSNEFLAHDKPYPGAVEFAQQLFKLGAHIIYLTGREENKMLQMTIDNLKRDQFPWCERNTTLLMKPSGQILDVAHKQSVKHKVNKVGTLLASFENEPVNIVALSKTFPESMHIFMDSIYSDHPSEPGNWLYKINSFLKT